MDCRDLERLIDAYLDRELPVETAGEVDSHLSGCAACHHKYAGLVALLRAPGPATVPQDLGDRITAAIHERTGAARERMGSQLRWAHLRWVRWAGAVAASLALFLMGWASSWYWTEPPPPVIETPALAPREQATVVISPWLASSCVQAMLLRGPANPMLLFVQAIAIEELTAPSPEPIPASRPYRRAVYRAGPPGQAPPEVEVSALELLLLSPFSRL